MKAGIFLLSIAFVTGCAAQNGPNVPRQTSPTTSSGPALKAPVQLKPQIDGAGGPGNYVFTSLGDASPVLYGKQLAHFYIGVREIDAIANGQTVVLGTSGTPMQMDLLQYQNGTADWMTQTSVPNQTYTQLRYVIDMASTQAIFADGSTVPVRFSGQYSKSSSGMGNSTTTTLDSTYGNAIDVTVNAQFAASAVVSIMSDFNLGESLEATNTGILMRPTLSAASNPGKVTGSVVNAYGNPVQNATVVAVGSNGQAVNSDTTASNGAFNIHALPPDTYQLLVYNVYTNAAGQKNYSSGATNNYQGFYGPSVSVSSGNTASAGSIGD